MKSTFENLFTFKMISVIVMLIVLVILDQWTKYMAVAYLRYAEPIYFFEGMFQLIYAENPGAFLGMGGGMSRSTRFVIFGLFVAIGLAFMFWSILKDKITNVERVSYTFILAGGIGNVIDRLTHDNGHVIDFLFIDLKFASWARTGVFNLADVAIVIGVILLLSTARKKSSIS